MLKRDPDRHVKLMPARYIMNNQLGETGELSNLSQKFNMQEIHANEADLEGEIGRESRQLQRNASATRELHQSGPDINMTTSMFGVSLDQFNSHHEQAQKKIDG